MRPKGAKGGKAVAEGAAKHGAGKAATVKLTTAERFARKERARLAAQTPADDPSNVET
jgi:hypothetical protein